MAILTEEQKKAYLEDGGSRCPFCESNDLATSSWSGYRRECWYDVECENCGEEWVALMHLTGVTTKEEVLCPPTQ